MSEQTKTCPDCNETKDIGCFYKNKSKPDGLCSQCKTCRKAATKTYYEANKDKMRAYCTANKEKMIARVKAHKQTQRGKYTIYKSSAKTRSIPFDLTFDEFMTFWQQDCHYCGDPIPTIGIDRINSDVGYTLANCVPCCTVCNRMKLDYSTEQWLSHMLKALKHQGIIY